MIYAARGLLYLLVCFGFASSSRLAWREWTTGEACPVVGSVPACYVAFAGYLAMLIGLVVALIGMRLPRIFYTGLVIAGGLALVGSVLELVQGNVCPRMNGTSIPMCYVSLAMSLVIGVLYRTSLPLTELDQQAETTADNAHQVADLPTASNEQTK